MAEGDDEDDSQTNLEINELLCWYQNMINTLEEPILAEHCCKKFSDKEIKSAKDILFSQLTSETSGEPTFKNRKAHKNTVSPSRNYCSDIYQLLQENKSQNVPKYVALDLSKLPLIRYESMDATGLILSHKKLEAEVYDLRDRIQDCTKLIKELTSNQSAITDVYKSIDSLKESMK